MRQTGTTAKTHAVYKMYHAGLTTEARSYFDCPPLSSTAHLTKSLHEPIRCDGYRAAASRLDCTLPAVPFDGLLTARLAAAVSAAAAADVLRASQQMTQLHPLPASLSFDLAACRRIPGCEPFVGQATQRSHKRSMRVRHTWRFQCSLRPHNGVHCDNAVLRWVGQRPLEICSS